MKNKSENFFIVKPTQGSQGDGIQIIKNIRDLNSWRNRPVEDVVV